VRRPTGGSRAAPAATRAPRRWRRSRSSRRSRHQRVRPGGATCCARVDLPYPAGAARTATFHGPERARVRRGRPTGRREAVRWCVDLMIVRDQAWPEKTPSDSARARRLDSLRSAFFASTIRTRFSIDITHPPLRRDVRKAFGHSAPLRSGRPVVCSEPLSQSAVASSAISLSLRELVRSRRGFFGGSLDKVTAGRMSRPMASFRLVDVSLKSPRGLLRITHREALEGEV
jgi:hypothetical protein